MTAVSHPLIQTFTNNDVLIIKNIEKSRLDKSIFIELTLFLKTILFSNNLGFFHERAFKKS